MIYITKSHIINGGSNYMLCTLEKIESVTIMDKILYAIVFFTFISFLATPAVPCPVQAGQKDDGKVAGAACSISDLRNMSKYKYAQENSVTGPPSLQAKKDLRPVVINDSFAQINKKDETSCKLGLCISEKLFGN
jgi:uncharacterized membrane protein